MDDLNIFAFTTPGAHYPEYISINRRDEELYVTVRSPRQPDGSEGSTATMRLPYDQLDGLIRSLMGARPANIYGSGDKSARKHIPTNAPAHSVATSHLEKAQQGNLRKPHHR